MVRTDEDGRAFGEAQLLHDRLGVAQRLVGHHAPDQLGLLDVGEQLLDAVEWPGQHGAVLLVAFEELQAQRLEAQVLRVQGEAGGDHGAGAAGHLVANQLVVYGRKSTLGTHRLADGDKVRRAVEQGAVHVEKYCAQAHWACHRLFPSLRRSLFWREARHEP